jgi:hypothetical protein
MGSFLILEPMRFVFKLAFIALFISCSTAEKKAPDLMSCVPQNTLAVVQLNDQNMLKSALSSASFLTQIMALDPTLYAETLSLLPDQFPSKALLCFTPEGKSSIGVSFLYTLQPQDSLQGHFNQQQFQAHIRKQHSKHSKRPFGNTRGHTLRFSQNQ